MYETLFGLLKNKFSLTSNLRGLHAKAQSAGKCLCGDLSKRRKTSGKSQSDEGQTHGETLFPFRAMQKRGCDLFRQYPQPVESIRGL
jgi:hypothetical protein